MNDIRLGVTLPQFRDNASDLRAAARDAEDLGLDSIWVFDHMWPLTGGKKRPALEAWTTLAWLAGATHEIGIGTLVTRSSLRHPALLAKMAATVASIAPGRLTVAIGSGDEMSRPENEAFGLPYYAADRRIGQLRSAVEVVVNHFRTESLTLEDEYTAIRDLPCTPVPPRIPPVWVAGRSDDALEVAATIGDGWNGWGGSSEWFAEDAGTVVRLAEGRAVELTWGGLVAPGVTEEAARLRAGDKPAPDLVWGTPERIAEHLQGFVEAGARHLVATPRGRWRPEDLELLADVRRRLLSP